MSRRRQNPSQELQNYQNNILKPALFKELQNKEIQYKLIKALRSKRLEKTWHLVLQPEREDAYYLLEIEKINIWFNPCTTQWYTTIISCFKCQCYKHQAEDWPPKSLVPTAGKKDMTQTTGHLNLIHRNV